MNTPINEHVNESLESNIVYIRPVAATDLPDDIMEKVGDGDDPHAILGEAGNVLGLAPNRELAFFIARENELAPVSVH